MPTIEVSLRLIPDPGQTGTDRDLYVVELPCTDLGPGPWNERNCSSMLTELQYFLRRCLWGFRALSRLPSDQQIDQQTMVDVEVELARMVRNGVLVDQSAVSKIRESLRSKKPESPPPPTRFERDPVI